MRRKSEVDSDTRENEKRIGPGKMFEMQSLIH
jgi:hypothetical protein